MNRKALVELEHALNMEEFMQKGDLDIACWKAYLSTSPPCQFIEAELKFADWLESDSIPKNEGVYIWLIQPDPSREEFRFLHIGQTAADTQSMRSRNQEHCKNLFIKRIDAIHRLSEWNLADGNFGTLGPNLRDLYKDDEVNSLKAAKAYMADIRVLFLIPLDACENIEVRRRAIKKLEGILGRSAHELLTRTSPSKKGRSDETTNSFSPLEAWESSTNAVAVESVAKALNGVVKMLPDETGSQKKLQQAKGSLS